jgi:hypothetical protein
MYVLNSDTFRETTVRATISLKPQIFSPVLRFSLLNRVGEVAALLYVLMGSDDGV